MLFIVSVCCISTLQAQVTRYIVQGGKGLKDGSSWQNASGDIQAVIDMAQPGDALWVAKGSYYGPSSLNFNFRLKEGVSVYGGFAGTETAIDQRNLSANITTLLGGYSSINENIVSGENISGQTVIDGFLLTPFNPNAYCRGMYLINSSPVIRNCSFVHCIAYSATATHNGYGSGICMEDQSDPQIINCRFESNEALNYGGAVYVANSAPQFDNCSFINNKTSSRGGGAYNTASSATYTHCIFQGNQTTSLSANLGGGICFTGGGSPNLDNCLFTNNQAGTAGAAIGCFEATLSITGCTITGNPAGNATGGAAIYYSATAGSMLTISNSIIWNNISTYGSTSLELYEIAAAENSAPPVLSHNLIRYGQYNSLASDPEFVDPAHNNFMLSATSPAVDAGDNTAADYTPSDTDLVGNNRVINDVVDMGAYEAITDKITNNGDAVFYGFNGSLNITGNAYENGLPNRYSWKMVISSPTLNGVFLADPADFLPYKTVLSNLGATFDSTHFVATDLSVMPAILQILTGNPGWNDFTGTILISRVVYPNSVQADSIVSNAEAITIDLPLPVHISSFTGKVKGGLASLSWRTGMETAFDHFELEKSLDAKAFVRMAEFAAKGDNSSYHASIPQVEPLAYYRLKSINKDGTFSYYATVLALTSQDLSELRVYPNPATTTIHVLAQTTGTLVIYDAVGRVVISTTLHQGLNEINTSQLSKGIYFGRMGNAKHFKLKIK